MTNIIYQSPTVTAEGLSLHFDGLPTHTMKPSSIYSRITMQQTLGRICKLEPHTSLGYLARILNGKLVRVASVTPYGVDYNFEAQ